MLYQEVGFNMHPLIKESLNIEQQKATVQMKNCVVAAGAGSGKTRVLAYRYAHLVIEHNFSVDTILTLTFTKKATAEMYERIYSTLNEIAESNKSTDIQKERALCAIQNFHTARIQTLDSFCSSIVRSASRLYGIRPDFSIDNDGVQEYCKKLALDFMLKYRNNPSIQKLLGMEKFEKMTESLFVNPIMLYSNISKDTDFASYIEKQIAAILKEWKVYFDKVFSSRHLLESYDNKLIDIYTKIEQLYIDEVSLSSYFSILGDTSKSTDEIDTCYKAIYEEIIPLFFELFTLKKVKLPGNKKLENKEEIKETIIGIRDCYDTLTGLAQYIIFYPQMLEVLPILEEYEYEVTEWKRSTGSLTYSDVSSLALQILTENIDIRNNEKSKINAIMIDEFQDNNAMQKNMLFLLAEKQDRDKATIPTASELCPEKLFFVGDEKQSIYKFRGADVSTFRELKTELNESLSLSTNYRSHPQLISGFNTFFGGYEYKGAEASYDTCINQERNNCSTSVFLQEHQLREDCSFPAFEAEYTKVFSKAPDKETLDKNLDKERIHICLLNATKVEDSDEKSEDADEEKEKTEDLIEAENLAIFTANKIAELCAENYNPKDIAILFRSYSTQYLYEKHLRRNGIPYVAENITNFFGDAPVNDMLALMRLIVYPKDALSFSIVLRSPFVRLNTQETLSCLLLLEQCELDIIFSKECAKNLSDSSKERYFSALNMYENLREKVHTITCAEIVRTLWHSLGYRYETLWNTDVALFSESYDFLFDIAQKIDIEGKNVSYFVDYLYELDKNGERLNDMNIPLERAGAVQLMSIHKSKGLEFPVVFIAGISSKGNSNKNLDKVYVDKAFGPSLNFPVCEEIQDCAKNYFFNAGKNLETKMAEAELRRVLYVAMTRAEKELYITGSFSINKDVQENLTKKGVDFNNVNDEDSVIEVLSEIFAHRVKKDSNTSDTSQVKSDFCVQNNTLFALLLPIISKFENSDNAPFSIKLIKNITRDELLREDLKKEKAEVHEVQERVKPFYDNANILTTPLVESPYRSPSHLNHTSSQHFQKNDNNDSGEVAIKELDAIIDSKKQELFNYSHFGTLCHAYTESLFTQETPNIPSEILHALNEKEIKTICDIAKKMAYSFYESRYGKEAKNAKWQKTEHDFKLLLTSCNKESVIVKGQIDLLYEKEDGNIVILDYKTDSVENPSTHYTQLAAYKRAICSIYSKDIKDVSCVLYYLRTGNCIEVSKEVDAVNLETIVFQ